MLTVSLHLYTYDSQRQTHWRNGMWHGPSRGQAEWQTMRHQNHKKQSLRDVNMAFKICRHVLEDGALRKLRQF